MGYGRDSYSSGSWSCEVYRDARIEAVAATDVATFVFAPTGWMPETKPSNTWTLVPPGTGA